MNTIKVKASRDYDVIIGANILHTLADHLKSLTKAKKICLVSDSNVFPLYGKNICQNLHAEGFDICQFVFPAGENSKNGDTYLSLLNFMAAQHITRTDCIIALGGGVVGDLAGFAAATYLRGIPFVQVPTSLLAMVDSSVGGKTAIDLPAGKNLCGAFYQPCLVLCDTGTLNTLPIDVFRDGCAEVIKYGILFDAELFRHLMDHGMDFDRQSVISRCVELKRDVVAEDEFDTGLRMKLNLGHTIGHGIEAGSNFSITHGKAVAAGMAIIARSAGQMGLCDAETVFEVLDMLRLFQLPTKTDMTAEQLFTAALSDKKRAGGTVNLIIPRKIGQCDIVPTPTENLQSLIEAGL